MTGGAPPQGPGNPGGYPPPGYAQQPAAGQPQPGQQQSSAQPYGSPQQPGAPYGNAVPPQYGAPPAQQGYMPPGGQPYGQPPYGAPAAGGYPPPGAGYPPPGAGYPPPGAGYPPQGYGAPGYGAPVGYPQPMVPGVSPESPYGIDQVTGLPFSDKQKMVAGLLQIFFGYLGVGRFYTGHTTIAIAQIAVSWLTCGVGSIWPFVDGILMLTGKVTDAQGRPLRDN